MLSHIDLCAEETGSKMVVEYEDAKKSILAQIVRSAVLLLSDITACEALPIFPESEATLHH